MVPIKGYFVCFALEQWKTSLVDNQTVQGIGAVLVDLDPLWSICADGTKWRRFVFQRWHERRGTVNAWEFEGIPVNIAVVFQLRHGGCDCQVLHPMCHVNISNAKDGACSLEVLSSSLVVKLTRQEKS